MSHVIEFEVTGLAGREEPYTQKLNRDLNVFFGLNGTGKTSLLKIINAAMERETRALRNVPFDTARVTIYSQDYKRPFTYRIDRGRVVEEQRSPRLTSRRRDTVLGPRIHSEGEPGLQWELEEGEIEAGQRAWRHEYLPTTRLLHFARYGEVLITPYEVSTPDEEGLDQAFENALKQHWVEFFGTVQARVRQLQQKALVDILNDVLTTKRTGKKSSVGLDWKTAYDEMVRFLKRQNPRAKPSSKNAFQRRYGESPLLRKVVSRIDIVEREIERVMAPQTKLEELVLRLFTAGKHVAFGESSLDVVTDAKKEIGLRSLSSGEKHVLFILVKTLMVGESSLIVDEPEISMHVDWQKELLSAMRELNDSVQIIAATHSPEILANVPDSKIFKL